MRYDPSKPTPKSFDLAAGGNLLPVAYPLLF